MNGFLSALISVPNTDIDDFLSPDEYLFIECLSPGSWYVTVWSKLRSSYRSLLQTVGIVYERGREALLRKLEAEARSKELDNEAKEFGLLSSKVDFALGLQDKVHDENLKKTLQIRVENELRNLLISDNDTQIKQISNKFINSNRSEQKE